MDIWVTNEIHLKLENWLSDFKIIKKEQPAILTPPELITKHLNIMVFVIKTAFSHVFSFLINNTPLLFNYKASIKKAINSRHYNLKAT